MASNLKLLKLISGEELLAEVISESKEDIKIKNPIRVVVVPSKTDPRTPQVGFAPWAEFSEEKSLTLNKFHVITQMTPIKEFVNQYNSMFGGILAPSQKLILPGT